ncbi:MAG TPA: TolC family protein, partial [Sphingobium sp.]
AAETARTYAQACGFAAQADVARETARLQDRTLDLTRRLTDAGRGTRREVDQAIVLAESARARVPTFEAERRASLYALATLTGRPPAQIDADASQCKTPPGVTTLIPVGDGAALLARRPDVRQAERKLAAETARIGVETAALFPSVRLLGSVSLGAQDIDNLGKASSFNFSVGPLISWSFPNIGVARARIKQARASADVSLAAFDGTVLTALKEVEQALARYSAAIEANAGLRRAETAANSAAGIAELRFNEGRDSFLQRLDAERDRATARGALAQSNAQLAEAQVALFKALGGGWEGAAEPERR